MKYETSGAFRQALEEKLRRQSLGHQQVLTRLRKMVAFDRFLARLTHQEPQAWIIKGGFALQLRLGNRARTTKDVDVEIAREWTEAEIIDRLRDAAAKDLGDWFECEVSDPTEAATGAPLGGLRFPILCLLDGRSFEPFHLDLGQGDPISDHPEQLSVPNLLDFAGLPATKVYCYPLDLPPISSPVIM